jgi:outer membrane protein OmpA-like peptidoglycan-associated protein
MLDDFAAALKNNPDARYEIQGHADNVGTARRNLIKSVERAQMVTNYLVHKGIFIHNLVPVGYGFDKPAVSNATAEGRAMNRRVELIQIDSQKEYDRLKGLQAAQEKSLNR